MSPTPSPQVAPEPPSIRLARAQAAIRALTTRGDLDRKERLELAHWQREWIAAWRDSSYVTAA